MVKQLMQFQFDHGYRYQGSCYPLGRKKIKTNRKKLKAF